MMVGVRKVESRLAVPGQEQTATLARVITGLPDLDWVCRSPEMILYHRQFLADDLKNQLDKFKTRPAACRLCPFWQAPA